MFDFGDVGKCEDTITRTWDDFRQQLANGYFMYDDLDAALNSTFLRVFDEIFQNCHQFLDKRIEAVLSPGTGIVRAARMKTGDSSPQYDRFLPKAEFITEDNRFSPPGKEWLYLAFADKDNSSGLKMEEKCALMECRANVGEIFALCNFKVNDRFNGKLLVDLTIAKESEYEDINQIFEQYTQQIYNREFSRLLVSGFQDGIIPRPDFADIEQHVKRWAMFSYAKLLADNIFLPVTKADKKLIYAPFQCMAQYILSKGYSGIIYSSTVFPTAKNVVLFDKMAAYPQGEIRMISVPADM